jgi:magnesium-transporting ATPase (P-type)
MDGMDSFQETKASGLALQLHKIKQVYQHLLDKVTPHSYARWCFTLLAFLFYVLRALVWIQGFHIISYGLGIYMLSLFINFLSPRFDPEERSSGDSDLPTRNSTDDFRPFVRRLPEFKFWRSSTFAVVFSITCTFIPALDLPVFWPILLFYFIFLFIVMMRKQITHMIHHKYVPFDYGKPHHASNSSDSSQSVKALFSR